MYARKKKANSLAFGDLDEAALVWIFIT
jgi:hypothetical protein